MNNEIKIRGNPDFFKTSIISDIPQHISLSGSVNNFVSSVKNNTYDSSSVWKYGSTSNSPVTAGGNNSVTESHLEHRKWVEGIQKTTITNNKIPSSFGGGFYVKINIFGPKDVPFNMNNDHPENFREQLFYTGWYLVVSVVNSFEQGHFNQTLELRALDYFENGTTPTTNQVSTNAQDKSQSQIVTIPPNRSNPKASTVTITQKLPSIGGAGNN
jgi:hypothetical protein